MTWPFALSALLLASMASGATPHNRNWDRAWWAMDDQNFFHAYPSAIWPDKSWEAEVESSRISRRAWLAPMIERGSKVRFQFGYDKRYLLETIRFSVSGNYDQVEAMLERQLGRPIKGDRSEGRCLDPDGRRKIEDPSGVGHVLAICLAEATFVDRKRGNAVYLETAYEIELERYGSHAEMGSAQLVTIESIKYCTDCTPRP